MEPTRVKHLSGALLYGGSWPYPQTLNQAGKANQDQSLQIISNIPKLRQKILLPGANFYKTFYGRSLRNFVISQSVCFWQAFQPSLLFACKARSLVQTGARERFFSLGQTPVRSHKHQTGLQRLANNKYSSFLRTFVHYGRKKFHNFDTWAQCYKTFQVSIFTYICNKLGCLSQTGMSSLV